MVLLSRDFLIFIWCELKEHFYMSHLPSFVNLAGQTKAFNFGIPMQIMSNFHTIIGFLLKSYFKSFSQIELWMKYIPKFCLTAERQVLNEDNLENFCKHDQYLSYSLTVSAKYKSSCCLQIFESYFLPVFWKHCLQRYAFFINLLFSCVNIFWQVWEIPNFSFSCFLVEYATFYRMYECT